MKTMREFSRLCNSLERIGIIAVVTRRPNEPYLLRWRYVCSMNWVESISLHSVLAVRHRLLTLSR